MSAPSVEVGAPARVTQNWGSNMHFTDLAIPQMFSAASLFTPAPGDPLNCLLHSGTPLYVSPIPGDPQLSPLHH